MKEQIKSITESGAKFCEAYKAVDTEIGFAHLKELLNAEAEGRLLVLPCKVGDMVYFLRRHFDESVEITQGKISMFQQKADRSWKFRISEGGSVFDHKIEEIGKTVFRTREEAEAALGKDEISITLERSSSRRKKDA